MKYLAWLGVICVALMTTSCASGQYGSEPSSSSRTYDAANFNGYWQLAPLRSDDGDRWFDDQTRSNFNDWGTTNRTDTRYRYRAWFLPDEFRIDAGRRTVRIEDSNRSLISAIDIDNDTRYGSYRDQGYNDTDTRAYWLSDRQFQVERIGRGGRRATQTFSLENRGGTLIVAPHIETTGGTRTFTRVSARG